eukprot:2259180-Prymnesium_polylepis.2
MLAAQARETTDHLAAREASSPPERLWYPPQPRRRTRRPGTRDGSALLRRAPPTRDLALSGRHGGRAPDPVAACEWAGDRVAHAQHRLSRHPHERMGNGVVHGVPQAPRDLRGDPPHRKGWV